MWLATSLYLYWVGSYEWQIRKSIGKPYEGKLHVRFDEGGTDSSKIIIFNQILIDRAIRLYFTSKFE